MYSSLLPDFQRFGYIVSDPEWTLYSLNDMNVLHNGGFVRELKDMLLRGLKHVSGCQVSVWNLWHDCRAWYTNM